MPASLALAWGARELTPPSPSRLAYPPSSAGHDGVGAPRVCKIASVHSVREHSRPQRCLLGGDAEGLDGLRTRYTANLENGTCGPVSCSFRCPRMPADAHAPSVQ